MGFVLVELSVHDAALTTLSNTEFVSIEAVYGAGTPGWHLTPTLEAVSNKVDGHIVDTVSYSNHMSLFRLAMREHCSIRVPHRLSSSP